MLHPELRELTDEQHGLAAVWQLRQRGWTSKMVRCRTAGLERVHSGVVRIGAPHEGRTQRWMAATLTAPATVLSHASAADLLGIRAWPRDGGSHATVTRPGRGRVQKMGNVLVHRSALLDPVDVIVFRGVVTTRPERTILDLTQAVSIWEVRKSLREALRLERTTIEALEHALQRRYARRAGVVLVRELVERYRRLQLHRCRSDAEAIVLEQLHRAGLPMPLVNVLVAGFEADLFFPDLRLILEIDGPSFHVLKDSDARRTQAWTAAGNTVRRLPSDTVFRDPTAAPSTVRLHMSDGQP